MAHCCVHYVPRHWYAHQQKFRPNITACFPYHHPAIKNLLWTFKYQHTQDVASVLAPLLLQTLRETTTTTHLVLVPVPISSKRQRERGFNQAEVLANAIASLDPEYITCDTTLVRKVRHTKPQVSCTSRSERQTNLAGAFGVGPSSPSPNVHYIVIDDVTTTGSTLTEVMHILKEQGAQDVAALTVAHG